MTDWQTHRLGERRAQIVAVLLAGLWAGCGTTDVPRYRLSGAVTIDGRPIEAGEILLEPDTSQGNAGPGGMAVIEDGYFDTNSGQGTVGGPHIARITAGTGQDVTELAPYGTLYSQQEFRVPIDLPKAPSERNLAVTTSE